MKKLLALVLTVFILSFCFIANTHAADPSYKVGQKIEVEWKTKWYPSTIKEIKEGKFFIHYDGWSDSWDEWVTTKRMRLAGPKYSVGDKIQVEWKGKWYPSTIKQIKDDKYFIHYDGWSNSWDEWVGEKRMKK